jgi:predicted MPP superfamily phosphohydrolase
MKKTATSIIFFLCFFNGFTQVDEQKQEKSEYANEIEIVKKSTNFLVLGDFGRNGEFHQKEVAAQMSKTASTIDANFIVTVGDNFYPNGVRSIQDPQWEKSFEDIYHQHSLHQDWHVCLGNHDYNGNIQAQIDYSKISRRWKLPSNYYKEIITLEDGSKALLLFVDTTPFIKSYYSKGNEIEENVKRQDTVAQKIWIINNLKNSDYDFKWKIVVGHHPMYSGGKRKNNKDTKDIEKLFVPIFEEYKVDAYLCGHEHDLQVIKPKKRHTTQFLSGTGCEVRPTGITEGTLFSVSEPGFMTFSITPELILTQLVDANGKILFKHEIKKIKK